MGSREGTYSWSPFLNMTVNGIPEKYYLCEKGTRSLFYAQIYLTLFATAEMVCIVENSIQRSLKSKEGGSDLH